MSARAATLPRRALRVGSALRPGPVARRRAVLVVALAAVLAGGYRFWLRDSGLVAVRDVTVTGISGPGSERVRAALTRAAGNMTTLNVDRAALARSVAGNPEVAGLTVSADFPSGLSIRVFANSPVALLSVSGRREPVAANGTLLPAVQPPSGLPLIRVRGAISGGRLAPGPALAAAAVAGDVPAALASRVGEIDLQAARGIVVRIDAGPDLVFGDAERARAKWAAAVRVLADDGARGAAYLDVRIPERPAAGGLPVQTLAPVAPAGSQAPAAATATTAVPTPVQGAPQP